MAPTPPPPPVPLPCRLADPWPVVTVCTVAWSVAAVLLHIVDAPDSWVWTCVLGTLLGFVGFTVMHLQRRAARRGVKGAQRGLR